MKKKLLITVFAAFLLFLTACSSDGSGYFFEQPAAFTTVNGTICSNGSTSYIAFVVDNTKKYGARIKKISGCSEKIDKSLKDKRDKKRGVYVGGTGVSIDKIIVNGEAVVAVASTGTVLTEHWKDKKNESLRLAAHKGRIVLRKFTNNVEHDKSFNRSLLLDFYPEIVKNYNNEGFFFTGSDFASHFIGFVDANGVGETAQIDFDVSDIAVFGAKIYLFNTLEGKVYKVDKELEPEDAATFEDFADGRMVGLSGKRLAFFKERKLQIYDLDFNLLNELETPSGFDISGVTAVSYSGGYNYRKIDESTAQEKVSVFCSECTEEENDILSENNIETSSSWETVEAETGNIVWIGMENGYVRAYDFNASSWLVEPFDSRVSSTYELEMRPYLSASYKFFPKNSGMTSDNSPFVSSVEVVRGLPSPVTYRFVYEGIFEGSLSKTGVYDASANSIVDEQADFSSFEIDPSNDYVVLLNRNHSEDCQIPEEINVILPIQSADSSTLTLGTNEYSGEIEKCFAFPLSYGIFSKGFYAVSKESFDTKVFAGRAVESDSDDVKSFEDDFISVVLKSSPEGNPTEKETSIYLSFKQAVPFVGFASADVLTEMANPAELTFFGFSPLTRRFIEYDMYRDIVNKIYK